MSASKSALVTGKLYFIQTSSLHYVPQEQQTPKSQQSPSEKTGLGKTGLGAPERPRTCLIPYSVLQPTSAGSNSLNAAQS